MHLHFMEVHKTNFSGLLRTQKTFQGASLCKKQVLLGMSSCCWSFTKRLWTMMQTVFSLILRFRWLNAVFINKISKNLKWEMSIDWDWEERKLMKFCKNQITFDISRLGSGVSVFVTRCIPAVWWTWKRCGTFSGDKETLKHSQYYSQGYRTYDFKLKSPNPKPES